MRTFDEAVQLWALAANRRGVSRPDHRQFRLPDDAHARRYKRLIIGHFIYEMIRFIVLNVEFLEHTYFFTVPSLGRDVTVRAS